MKDEGPFILEWLAYNRLIGVTDFVIYTNDCSDGTVALLAALQAAGLVQALPNPAPPGKPLQMAALAAAQRLAVLREADWVFVTDVDEFLDIRAGAGRIPDLIAACGWPLAISVPMRMMANGGVADFADLPVVQQFTRSHAPEAWNGRAGIEVKTLTARGFPVKYLGVHRPFLRSGHDLRACPVAWTDGTGRVVPRAFMLAETRRRRYRLAAAGATEFASLRHYTLRSLDSYLVKSARGDANRPNRRFGLGYWLARNDAAVAAPEMLRWLGPLQAEMARLRAVPGVAAAHEACVARHRAMVAGLMARAEFRALRAALVAASPDLGGSGLVEGIWWTGLQDDDE